MSRRELQKKLEVSQTEYGQLTKDVEAERLEKAKAQTALSERTAELAASTAREQQLAGLNEQLQARVEALERSAAEKAAAEAARLAAEGPPPPSPEEVQRNVLRAFDAAKAAVCAELAARVGAPSASVDEADVSMVEAEDSLNADRLMEAGVSMDQAAEQYLRAAMEAAVAAVEPARLEAASKWKLELKKRRQLQDVLQELKGSIRVMCRVRPLAPSEGEGAVSVPSDGEVVITQPGKDGRKSFVFDHAFGPVSGQPDVFEEVEPCIESTLAGFNVCIFAYGQTGSGKTFTMEGKRADEDCLLGINPRSLRRLFEMISERKQLSALGGAAADDGWSFEVAVSYLEIYNENLRDLLTTASPTVGKDGKKKEQNLDVRSVEGRPVSIPGLTSVPVASVEEVESTLMRGAGRRKVAATKCNSESSRSHSIVMVTVTGNNPLTGATSHGKLHLVDLAGSERVKKSGVSGEGMTEAQNINQSLSALGDVMANLQQKSKHIPYRNSKLTQVLSDSLGGNSKTFMIVNVNPSSEAASETLCSLNFATRVRRVELGKASGKTTSGASLQEVKAARGAEERAQAELSTTQGRVSVLEREVREARSENERIGGELAQQQQALSEYRENEELLKGAAAERQQHELSEERKRAEPSALRLALPSPPLSPPSRRPLALAPMRPRPHTLAPIPSPPYPHPPPHAPPPPSRRGSGPRRSRRGWRRPARGSLRPTSSSPWPRRRLSTPRPGPPSSSRTARWAISRRRRRRRWRRWRR